MSQQERGVGVVHVCNWISLGLAAPLLGYLGYTIYKLLRDNAGKPLFMLVMLTSLTLAELMQVVVSCVAVRIKTTSALDD